MVTHSLKLFLAIPRLLSFLRNEKFSLQNRNKDLLQRQARKYFPNPSVICRDEQIIGIKMATETFLLNIYDTVVLQSVVNHRIDRCR